jgi:hypothetical protein
MVPLVAYSLVPGTRLCVFRSWLYWSSPGMFVWFWVCACVCMCVFVLLCCEFLSHFLLNEMKCSSPVFLRRKKKYGTAHVLQDCMSIISKTNYFFLFVCHEVPHIFRITTTIWYKSSLFCNQESWATITKKKRES